MKISKKLTTLLLSLGLVAGMGTAAFAADDATGWTGSIDLGVVLNPNSEVSAKKINISFYKGTPSIANQLYKKRTKRVKPEKAKRRSRAGNITTR